MELQIILTELRPFERSHLFLAAFLHYSFNKLFLHGFFSNFGHLLGCIWFLI